MDTNSIRIKNLRRLINERTKTGKIVEFADSYSLDPAQISGLLNGHRSIGEKLARKIERQSGAPAGYLDEHGSKVAEPPARYQVTTRQPEPAPAAPVQFSKIPTCQPGQTIKVALPSTHSIPGVAPTAEAALLITRDHALLKDQGLAVLLHEPTQQLAVYRTTRIGPTLFASHPSGIYPAVAVGAEWTLQAVVTRIEFDI